MDDRTVLQVRDSYADRWEEFIRQEMEYERTHGFGGGSAELLERVAELRASEGDDGHFEDEIGSYFFYRGPVTGRWYCHYSDIGGGCVFEEETPGGGWPEEQHHSEDFPEEE